MPEVPPTPGVGTWHVGGAHVAYHSRSLTLASAPFVPPVPEAPPSPSGHGLYATSHRKFAQYTMHELAPLGHGLHHAGTAHSAVLREFIAHCDGSPAARCCIAAVASSTRITGATQTSRGSRFATASRDDNEKLISQEIASHIDVSLGSRHRRREETSTEVYSRESPIQGANTTTTAPLTCTRRRKSHRALAFSHVARPGRFELPTFGSVDRRSIQLSYGRVPAWSPGSALIPRRLRIAREKQQQRDGARTHRSAPATSTLYVRVRRETCENVYAGVGRSALLY